MSTASESGTPSSTADHILLLVEDNPDDEMLCIRALQRGKVQGRTVVARDGIEAIDYLFGTGPYAGGAPPPLPDWVLLDLNMPRMNGFEVLRALRGHERTRLLPVIILTTSVDEADVSRGYACGANSYVRKVVDFREFSEAVELLGTYWTRVNVTVRRE